MLFLLAMLFFLLLAEGNVELNDVSAAFACHRHLVLCQHHGLVVMEVGIPLSPMDGDAHRIV